MSDYLIDSNALIEAKNRYYGLDFAPCFWDFLQREFGSGRIKSITHVYDEVAKGGDDLTSWLTTNLPRTFFDKADNSQDILNIYNKIYSWAGSSGFRPYAISEFFKGADPWLCAYAKQHGYSLVSHEVYKPNITRKIPIPNVCKAFNIEYLDTFDLIRACDVKFGLLP